MRRFLGLGLLLAVLSASPAFSGSGTQYSGLTTMTFQNGVAPTAGYTGCVDTYINSSAADSGLNHGSADSLRVSGASNASTFKTKQNKTLILFDISALPDSGVIASATLWVWQKLGATGTGYTDSLLVLRCLRSWTVGTGSNAGTAQAASVDWQDRGTGADKGQWLGAGATSVSTAPTASGYGPSTGLIGASSDSAVTASIFTGTDTLWTGANGGSGVGDYARDFIGATRLMTGAGALKWGWILVDITAQVRRWHIGANRNDGLILATHNNANNKVFAFASSDFADKLYRPKLVVTYLDPTTIGGGSTGTRLTFGRGR
jgi:hypothetical protein